MFKTVSAAVIGLGLLAPPSFAHTQADATKAVPAFVSNYEKLFNDRDAKGLAALFADDGVQASPGSFLTNRDDIEKRYQKMFDAKDTTDFRITVKQMQAEGNIVFIVGQFAVNKANHPLGGNVVDIFEWQGDALKFRVLSFSVSPPAVQQ